MEALAHALTLLNAEASRSAPNPAKIRALATSLETQRALLARADSLETDGRIAELARALGDVATYQNTVTILANEMKILVKEADLGSKWNEAMLKLGELEPELKEVKNQLDKERKAATEREERLKVTGEVIAQLAPAVCAEKRSRCAWEFFQNLKLNAPELLDLLFKSMGLDLAQWCSWDSQYEENSDSMLEALLSSEKQEPEKLRWLRLKLSAMGRDYIDAITAVRDYRDLKLAFAELQKRTHPHIIFSKLGPGWKVVNSIPEKFKQQLTGDALRDATATLKNDQIGKLEWLEIVQQLLKPDSGIGSLLLKEIRAADREVQEQRA